MCASMPDSASSPKSAELIVKATSPDDYDITRGNLCIKGRFGFQHVRPTRRSAVRLSPPPVW